MNKLQYIEEAEKNLFKIYNRMSVVFERGNGVFLYDNEGNEYLDFASGIGVIGLGYGNKEYENALIEQIKKLIHTSNLFYNIPMIEASEKLIKYSQMNKVFFTNSGTEAIEGAIKTAKKYMYNKKGPGNYEIIAMENSFHGRTIGSLSITGTLKYREPFDPLMPNVKFSKFNNFDSVLNNLSENTCAIIMETIQGEGGLYPIEEGFLKNVKKICEEKDILLILDEIQCGMGRTGKMFAYQNYDILPDIVTVAKTLGNGIPVGAFLVNSKVAESSLTYGDHGTTYGGNPLSTAAVSKVFDIFDKQNVLGHVNEIAPYLKKTLDYFVKKYDFIIENRGKGLMQGLVLTIPVKEVIKKALYEEHLVLLSAGKDVLRLLPPLIITKQDIDLFQNKLEKIFDTF